MKINRLITSGILAAGLALTCSTVSTRAQTIITNTYTFSFPTTGPTETPFNDTTWIYWYGSPGGNSPIVTDPTTDASNPTPGSNTSSSGSLEIVSPLAGYSQNVFFGCFADSGSYNFSVEANSLLYSSISFDLHVAPGTPLSGNGDYGSIGVGFINSGYGQDWVDTTLAPDINNGYITIPASAATNWFHAVVPIDQTQTFGDVPGIAFQFNSYNGYPLFTETNWIDNISFNGNTAPPPPPPTLNPPQIPIVGLNLLDTTASAADDRYQVINSNDNSGGLSFVGQASVTYSWNIKTFPSQDSAYGYQAHFFIVSGSDNTNTATTYPDQYDQAADYNLANCIFVTIQSDGNGGGVCNFRYKTNEIGGNGMLFNALPPSTPTATNSNTNGWPIMPIAALDSAPLLGQWSLNFANNTNVTITSPSGATTNFSIDPASAALFADPASILLGAQPNGTGYTNGLQDVVYSSFSLAGTPAAFTDNFLTDASLNTNYWSDFGNDLNGTVLVPPGSAYWVSWSLPAVGFGLYAASNLPVATGSWKGVSAGPIIKNGPTDQVLIASTNLPNPNLGYFTMISNSLSQLLVLFPGQTFTPGVAPGYSGSPTAISAGGSPTAVDVTVIAVDTGYNLVASTDSVQLTASTDPGPPYYPSGPQNLVNGMTTFSASGSDSFFFSGDPGSWTVTATDESNPTVTGTSAAVTVN